MKKNDFAQYIADFLTQYLAVTRNLSANTIVSYRDAFIILLKFMNNTYSIKPEKLGILDFSPDRIKDFLNYLETELGNSNSTRNQRLIAIPSFFSVYKYAESRVYVPFTADFGNTRKKERAEACATF